MTGFIIWMGEQWRAWDDHIGNHAQRARGGELEAFGIWLAGSNACATLGEKQVHPAAARPGVRGEGHWRSPT